jgi:CelD/BcsL family acetyltransferase involved in cellulose biosynthesis
MNEWSRDMAFEPKPGMRRTAAAGLTLCVSADIDDFRQFWPTSGETGAARRHAFQNADFLQTWCATIGEARLTEFVFVGIFTARGQPVMFLPLGIETHAGLRMLTWLDGGVVDYNCPVLYPASQNLTAAEVAALWAALRRLLPPLDMMLLEKMPEEVDGFRNPLLALGASRYPHSGYVTTLALPVAGKPDTAGGSCGDGGLHLPFAQDTRRNLRRLGKMGILSFQQAGTAAERDRFLAAMIRQKTRRYIETRGTDSFDRPGYRAFFRQATERFAESGLLHLSAVLLDDRILATHWGYVAGSRFYYLMPSYEGGEWPRYSPGRLLLHWLMNWAARNGIATFDQGIGDEAYKARYCDRIIALSQIETAFTLKGQVYLAFRRARRTAAGGPLRGVFQSAVRAGRRLKLRLD